MALTLESMQKLKSKGFDAFYTTNKVALKSLVTNSEKYVKTYLPAGGSMMPADIALHVVPALRANSSFIEYAEGKKLSPNRWANDFADYIVEQAHPSKIE